MQNHHIDVAKRIEFTPAISTKGDQRQWNVAFAISVCSSGSGTEDVLQ
jgi:hypothetical protein